MLYISKAALSPSRSSGGVSGQRVYNVLFGKGRCSTPTALPQEEITTSSYGRSYGLTNLGQTYYVNAILHGLYSCKCFRENILCEESNTNAITECKESLEIARTFHQLQNSDQDTNKVFNAISSIESCSHFDVDKQQDRCELLMKLQDH